MDSKERIAKALQIATDTKVFEMAPGASQMAPDIFKKLFPGRKAVIVADINTWPALGEKVYGMFLSAGIKTDKYIIDKKEFHAEWKYIEMVDKIIEGDYEAAKTIEDDENHVEADATKAFKPASDEHPWTDSHLSEHPSHTRMRSRLSPVRLLWPSSQTSM